MRKNEILGLDGLCELSTDEMREVNGGAFNFGQLFSFLGGLFNRGGSSQGTAGGGFNLGSLFSGLFGGGGGQQQTTASSGSGLNFGSLLGGLFR